MALTCVGLKKYIILSKVVALLTEPTFNCPLLVVLRKWCWDASLQAAAVFEVWVYPQCCWGGCWRILTRTVKEKTIYLQVWLVCGLSNLWVVALPCFYCSYPSSWQRLWVWKMLSNDSWRVYVQIASPGSVVSEWLWMRCRANWLFMSYMVHYSLFSKWIYDEFKDILRQTTWLHL